MTCSRSQKSSHKSRFSDTELFFVSLNPLKFKIRPCFSIQIPSFIELRGQQPNLVHFLGWMATSGEIIDSKISSANCYPNKDKCICIRVHTCKFADFILASTRGKVFNGSEKGWIFTPVQCCKFPFFVWLIFVVQLL